MLRSHVVQWGGAESSLLSYITHYSSTPGVLIGHPVFPMFVHYSIMWLILLVFKFSALAPMVDWGMFLPFWVTTFVALQLSRIFVAMDPTTTATLYLSFGPFAVFCVASRELHSYLSGLWFIFLLLVNVRRCVAGRRTSLRLCPHR